MSNSTSRSSGGMRSVLCAVGLAALSGQGCADLPILSKDVCGNGVVEPAVHESCDGQATCGLPGTSHACHFVCDPAKGGCPEGYGCGVDGECRRPTSDFEVLTSFSTPTTLDLLVGDVDRDGCSEVLHTTRRATIVTAFDSQVTSLCAAGRQEISSGDAKGMTGPLPPAPMLADVSTDGQQDLLIMGRGLFGDGVYVSLHDGGPTFESLLYPTVRAEQDRAKPLRARRRGKDGLLLFLGAASDEEASCNSGAGGGGAGGSGGTGGMGMGGMGTGGMGMGPPSGGVGIAWVGDPAERPVGLKGLPGTLDTLVLAQAVDLNPDEEPDPAKRCDEVVIAIAGEPRIHVLQLCEEEAVSLVDVGAVDLDAGAKIRSRNASMAVVDFNDDGALDLVTNATDGALHVAYGDGTMHFQSKPPGAGAPDHQTGSFTPGAESTGDPADPGSRFVAGDFDQDKSGPEIVALPCPEAAELQSPVCGAYAGSCESVVTDIDGDGRLDILSTAEQEPGISVRRGLPGGVFHETFLDTTCPPHELTAGDLDGDGVSDLAFFDQIAATDPRTGEPRGATALAIAYGKAYSSPEAPVTSGLFERANGLTQGQFSPGTPGTQLYATRRILCEPLGSGAALVEGQTARLPVAPFYFPAGPGDGTSNILSLRLAATAVGRFFPDEEGTSEIGLAIVTRDLSGDPMVEVAGSERLWLVAGHAGANSLQPLTLAGTEVPACESCVLAPVDADGDGAEEVLWLGDGEAVLFGVAKTGEGQSTGFEVRTSFSTKGSFQATDTASNPVKYAPRPIVFDLDGDGQKDVIARSTTGALVAFWGAGDGAFEEAELLPSPCEKGATCAGYSAALLQADSDGAREVLVIGPGEMALYDLDPAARKLVPLAGGDRRGVFHPPLADSDFTVAGAGDFDGDGVDDIVFLGSSSFVTVLRGVPASE